MVREQEEALSDIFGKVRFVYRKYLDFTRTDSDGLREIVRRLTNAAFRFNLFVITDYGGRSGRERILGHTEQAIAAAFQTFGGVDPHPHPFQKAAVILRGINQGHPFSDANKRTGFLTAWYYPEKVGYPKPESIPVDEVAEFCRKISANELGDINEIATQLASFWKETTTFPSIEE